MRARMCLSITGVIATGMLAVPALADTAVGQSLDGKEKIPEQTVFVTGSLIPQRIQRRAIGTTTVSPLRVIDRNEIDQSGRRTTKGALVNEPSVQVFGR